MAVILKSKNLRNRFREYSDFVLEGGFVSDEENRIGLNTAFETIQENKQGLLVIGNPGGGKTLFFEILQKIMHPKSEYFFSKISVLDVVLQFNNKEIGHLVFRKWADKNVFFDDLGTEDRGYLFGEKVEVFEKFIQFRYDLFRHKKIKTHFTTNLSYTELRERYGARCVSRLEEMCKVIMIGEKAESTDRRKLHNFKSFPPVFYEPEPDPGMDWIKEAYKQMKENPAPPSEYKGLGSKMRNKLGT